LGNKTKKIDALGYVSTYTYDGNGNVLTETTTRKTTTGDRTLTTTKTYDANGKVKTVLDAENGLMQYDYDANGNQILVIDAKGRRTEMRYDAKNQLIETIYPDDTPATLDDNLRVQVTYDAAGNKTGIVDQQGRMTTYSYDALNRPTGMILPDDTPNDWTDNPKIEVKYDQAGQMRELVKDGIRTTFEYDAAGRITQTRNWQDGQVLETKTLYDAAGRKIATTDALGHTTRFVYDAMGQLIETRYPDGTTSKTSYDASGNAIAKTDQAGYTTRYEYDALDRLTAVIDAKLNRTDYQYDEAGHLIAQKDANGHITRYEYDDLGRRIAVIRPSGQQSDTTYDAIGNVIKTKDFNGDSITYDYDIHNQLIAKHFLNENRTVEFSYTDNGRRESVTDERGVTRYEYNTQGQLLSRTEPDDSTISYTYDTVTGKVATVISLSGTTTYQYNSLGQLATVTDTDNRQTIYRYDVAGNLIETQRPNGTTQTYRYDALNRPIFLENKDQNGTVLSRYSYTFDAAGNRTAVEELGDRKVVFAYDELHRLTQEIITDPVNGDRALHFTYDKVGNRLSKTETIAGQSITTTYTYDGGDRLLTETTSGVTTTYTYDNNGNILTVTHPQRQTVYDWNTENRLVGAQITENGITKQVAYQYDADGIRVASIVNNQETRYLVDTNRPYAEVLEEYSPTGQVQTSYVHGLDLISQTRANDTLFYLSDAHSGVRQLSDESGQTTDTYTYDAYGNLVQTTGNTQNSYLYRSEQFDSNLEMQYLRARYYDQNSGRFVSTDPFEGWQEQPMSRHTYLYGNNNPVKNSDPTGYFTLTEGQSIALILNIFAGYTQAIVGQIWQDIAQSSVNWNGYMVNATYSIEGTGQAVSGFIVDVTSDVVNNEQTRGVWVVLGVGLAFGPPVPSPVSFSAGVPSPSGAPTTISSPPIFGVNPVALSGFFNYVGLDGIGIGGVSGSAFSMGYGTSAGFNLALGLSLGASAFTGISVPLFWDTDPVSV
jgi:RHS repeat-associated protein